MLIRAHAKISVCYVCGHGVLFTTTEFGNYLVEPLATSHLVIDKEFRRSRPGTRALAS
jgi:hypothetical protein